MNINNPRISIAMATYNGERYLLSQLESLANQSKLPYELVACDDGSTDKTIDLLNDFAKSAPFPVRVFKNKETLGFADNFLKCAQLCEGDWTAFCDQDDVWLPNKLQNVALGLLRNPNACLFLQSALICDKDLRADGRVFPGSIRPGTYRMRAQFGFWVWPGFLQTFQANLLREAASLKRPRSYYPFHSYMPHDKLTCLIANALGGIVVLDEPAALYRRHSGAVTGDYAAQGLRRRIEKALPVGSDHYAFLADVASETADYLTRVAAVSHAEAAKKILGSAVAFEKLSTIHSARADLYSGISIYYRLRHYVKIASKGGYIGPTMISIGLKSGVKDLLCVLGLIGK
jgi:glycosyltransferase involved in cell wall biosynthesis